MAETDRKKAELDAAQSMKPIQGTVEVDIPIDVLWRFFTRADLWSRWNECFLWAHNRDLVLGDQLIWCFKPIKPWMPYVMPAIAKIVELVPDGPERKVTWEVVALPGFYARHTYHMEDLGNGRTRFGSWEKAMGWSFQLMKFFWIAHFTFVKDRSVEGAARTLDAVYRQTKQLDETTVRGPSALGAALKLLLVLLVLGGGAFAAWFYLSFSRLQARELAPGVHAVLGGGGNSLVVEGKDGALLVDTKFAPGAGQLHAWLEHHVKAPVTTVVNTHYHYDHTLGNELYPNARILAYQNVAQLLDSNEQEMAHEHPKVKPTQTVGDTPERLMVGDHEVDLIHVGPAHTAGDLVVYLPKEKILATGDLLFHTYYPFFDLNKGGADLPGLIKAIRKLAAEYPDATVLPGHGPVARAQDLNHYADYLEYLYTSVQDARRKGLTEDQAVKAIDLSQWKRSILPSFHQNHLQWATAERNIRNAYELVQKDPVTAAPNP